MDWIRFPYIVCWKRRQIWNKKTEQQPNKIDLLAGIIGTNWVEQCDWWPRAALIRMDNCKIGNSHWILTLNWTPRSTHSKWVTLFNIIDPLHQPSCSSPWCFWVLFFLLLSFTLNLPHWLTVCAMASISSWEIVWFYHMFLIGCNLSLASAFDRNSCADKVSKWNIFMSIAVNAEHAYTEYLKTWKLISLLIIRNGVVICNGSQRLSKRHCKIFTKRIPKERGKNGWHHENEMYHVNSEKKVDKQWVTLLICRSVLSMIRRLRMSQENLIKLRIGKPHN